MPGTESFAEACAVLVDHLRRQGQSTELLWVFRDDVTGRGRRLFAHPSPPATNHKLYQRHFEFGVRQSRGIRVEVACFAAGRACCHVWVPEDDIAADQAMLTDGLRVGFAVESSKSRAGFPAQQCASRAEFSVRRLWCRLRGKSRRIDRIPLRTDVRSIETTGNA